MRKYISIHKALKEAREEYGYPTSYGITACYEIENMGFCKDGVTRWYQFTGIHGEHAYTIKR